MHKIPFTNIGHIGLENHVLDIGKPTKLSDVFCKSVAHGLKHSATPTPSVIDGRMPTFNVNKGRTVEVVKTLREVAKE